jgi:hypothetical protein
MKKPRKEAAEPAAWKVYIMRSKLTWLGSVDARDEQEAIDRAIEKAWGTRSRSVQDQRAAGVGGRRLRDAKHPCRTLTFSVTSAAKVDLKCSACGNESFQISKEGFDSHFHRCTLLPSHVSLGGVYASIVR